MKIYQKPHIEINAFDSEEIMAASSPMTAFNSILGKMKDFSKDQSFQADEVKYGEWNNF